MKHWAGDLVARMAGTAVVLLIAIGSPESDAALADPQAAEFAVTPEVLPQVQEPQILLVTSASGLFRPNDTIAVDGQPVQTVRVSSGLLSALNPSIAQFAQITVQRGGVTIAGPFGVNAFRQGQANTPSGRQFFNEAWLLAGMLGDLQSSFDEAVQLEWMVIEIERALAQIQDPRQRRQVAFAVLDIVERVVTHAERVVDAYARIDVQPLFEKVVDVEAQETLAHLRDIVTEVRHTAVQEAQQQAGCRYDICTASIGAEASGFGEGDPGEATGKIIATGAKTETKSNCKNNRQFYTLRIKFTVEVTGIPLPSGGEHPDSFVPPKGGLPDQPPIELGSVAGTAAIHAVSKDHAPSDECIEISYADREISAEGILFSIVLALDTRIRREMEERFLGRALDIEVDVDPEQIFSKTGKFSLVADYFGLGDFDPAHRGARRSDQAIKEIEIKLVDGAASVPPSSSQDPD